MIEIRRSNDEIYFIKKSIRMRFKLVLCSQSLFSLTLWQQSSCCFTQKLYVNKYGLSVSPVCEKIQICF